jgi:hypothetical protein
MNCYRVLPIVRVRTRLTYPALVEGLHEPTTSNMQLSELVHVHGISVFAFCITSCYVDSRLAIE